MWTPPARELNEEEKATVARLRTKQEQIQKRQSALYAEINGEVADETKGMKRGSEEWTKVMRAVNGRYGEQRSAIRKEAKEVADAIGELVPAPQRKSFVWLYERQ